jgi:hypothetical protein
MLSNRTLLLCGPAAAFIMTGAAFGQSCGDPSSGSCCAANPTPFCNDADCCNLICGGDPFCCNTQWDQICANAAVAQCTGCQGGGGGSCGDPAAGDCCAANTTPYCSDAVCCDLVCAADAFCCNNLWDQVCANAALVSCASCGGGGGGGGCDPKTNGEVFVGPNSFATSLGIGNLDLTGICDPGPYGDDVMYNTAYYQFTAPETATYRVTTCNLATWDTRLAVLESCDPTSTVACNDDGAGCAAFTSLLNFSATANVTYIIAIGGFAANNVGTGTVTIEIPIACGDPTAGECCTPQTGTAACNDESCCNAVCAADAFCCDTEWDQFCVDAAAFLCSACGAGSCKLDVGTTAEAELCGEDLNGGCNGGGAAEFAELGQTITGTFWADGDIRDTDWYVLEVTEGTEVTVTIKSNMPCFTAFVDLACGGIIGTPSSGNCGGSTTFCFAPGSYYVVALPSTFNGFPCGFEFGNDYSIAITGVACDASAPANDLCADATVANLGANPFDNTFASTDVPAATCGFSGAPFTKDVWFTFTPATSETFTLETCSGPAPFDTGIEVYDACPEAGGVLIGCNDDGTGCPNFSSSLSIALSAGTTYTIRVGGWNGATGATDLIITGGGGGGGGPPNDLCANASTISVGTTAFSTVGATGVTVACLKFNNQNIYNDIWYSYTADGNGDCTISLCGASYDTKIAVFDGCSGALLACNDDSATCGTGSLQSELTFTATCDTTYKVCVGAFGTTGFGSGNIVLTQLGKCSPACPADLDGDGFVSAADLSALLGNWGNSGAGDIDGDGFVNAADLSALLATWGPCS